MSGYEVGRVKWFHTICMIQINYDRTVIIKYGMNIGSWIQSNENYNVP